MLPVERTQQTELSTQTTDFNPFADFAQSISRSRIIGKLLKFTKHGDWIAGGRECQHCPFSVACGVQRKDVPAENKNVADPQFVAEISDLARQYKLAQFMVEKSETDVRQLQTDIKSRLQEKQIRRVVGNGVSVSWAQVKGRETTDVKGLREAAENAGIDLDQYTSVADPSDRLTVTVKETSPGGE